jgi:hypothetical protein
MPIHRANLVNFSTSFFFAGEPHKNIRGTATDATSLRSENSESDPLSYFSYFCFYSFAHDRVGSSADPTLHGHFKYPNNLDQSLNDTAADKTRKYRADYNNRPPSPVSFIPPIVRQAGYIVNLLDFYSYSLIGKLTVFFTGSGVQSTEINPSGQFHFHRAVFSQQLKSKVGLTLVQATALRINLNLDGTNERRVNLFVCSLPSHRHSYIGFIFSFRFINS